MRNNLIEAKAQRWRALATYTDGRECLLYVGGSFSQVSENYDAPYYELLTDEERALVKTIQLQKWIGAPDAGHWESQRPLPIPESMVLKIATKSQIQVEGAAN
jgi:hypothetical protein